MNKQICLLLIIFCCYTCVLVGQETIKLYPAKIPNSKESPAYQEKIQIGGDKRRYINHVKDPTLTVYFPEQGKRNGVSVIICPGGGYQMLAIDHEGIEMAKRFNEYGITAFILKYRLPNDSIMENKTIGPLQDAQRAIQLVRERSAEWKLDPGRVGIIGASAGGHLAATAGTSGVIYAVADGLAYDKQSRVNSFAHINHTKNKKRIGVLLCINGTGIMNSWVKKFIGTNKTYKQLNDEAALIPAGSDGLLVLPFGNGAERMLNNELIGSSVVNIDLNKHTPAHLYRAAQEGIAYAFRYGLDIMRENNIEPKLIRAGKANMFLSDVFIDAFVNVTNVPVELYENDGSVGAALGAGIGAKIFDDEKAAFQNMKRLKLIEPNGKHEYDKSYEKWMHSLNKELDKPQSNTE